MANEYRVTQFPIEVLHGGAPAARVSQFPIEVLHGGATAARVSQFTIEALVSISSVSGGRRHCAMLMAG